MVNGMAGAQARYTRVLHALLRVNSRLRLCLSLIDIKARFLLLLVLTHLLAPILASQVQASVANIKKEHFSFTHVLPNEVEALGYINAIEMDQEGFIWFASNNGLARFDGHKLLTFKHAANTSNSLASNLINDLLVDSQGQLWVATEAGLNLFNPESNSFSLYTVPEEYRVNADFNALRTLHEDATQQLWLGSSAGLLRFDHEKQTLIPLMLSLPNDHTASQLAISDISSDNKNNLWLATLAHGLVKISRYTMEAQFNLAQTALLSSQKHSDIRSVFVDNRNVIWAGTYHGDLLAINQQGKVLHQYAQPEGERRDVIWSITQDRFGRLWVGDGGGINRLSQDGPWLVRYAYNESDNSSPGNYAVRTIFEDDVGDLWLGFFPSGVDRLDKQASAFQNFRHHSQDDNSLTDGGVLSVTEDEQGNLWIGTGFGLSHFNRSNQHITRFYHDDNNSNTLSGNTSLSLAIDAQHHLWVGSWSQGLNKINLQDKTFEHFKYQPSDPNSLLGVEPWRLLIDSQENLWVATELGLNRFNPNNSTFSHFQPIDKNTGKPNNLYSRDIYEDKNNNFWIASDRGLFLFDRNTYAFRQFQHNVKQPHSLSANFVKAIFEDDNNNLWVGTHGGGLNLMDRDTETFKQLGKEQGLEKLAISGITQDQQGLLWLNTLQGLYTFHPTTGQFTQLTKRHGLLSNVYNRNAIITLKNGDIFAGSTGGFSLITPAKIEKNPTPPKTVITGFSIFNKTISLHDEKSPLTKTINHTKSITLDYDQSVFSFEFSSLSYQLTDQNTYMYILEGFDKDWHAVGHRRTATYTNLDAGTYIFKVKSANHDGVWSNEPASVEIIILSPPWLSWWAYALYCLSAALIIFFIFHIQSRKVQLQHEKTLNNKLLKLDKFKDAFLACTSHELRTPLNGIIGIAENLMDAKQKQLDKDTLEKLAMITNSGKRLASLVNDILDYSKLSEQSLLIQRKAVTTHQLVSQVDALLRPLAEAKNLQLINDINQSAPAVMADENRLQQILINLIGNAIKYTTEGSVKLSCKRDGNELCFIIRDSGIGIAENELGHIFEVFHQVEHDGSQTYSGTGLGLAIAKQLIELQDGRIHVTSAVNEGSVFSFTLPLANTQNPPLAPQQASALQPNNAGIAEHNIATPQPSVQAQPNNPPSKSLPCLHSNPQSKVILIVDDDTINRIVLSGILQLHNYQVEEAISGQAALDYFAQGRHADMVIMDVMMPGMNGYELCQKLRTQYPVTQLPIIFLSANLTDEDLNKAYLAGANNFLTKPISKYALLPQVANLLTLTEKPPT